MPSERWKWVVGYEGRYTVSNLGRIRSYVWSTGRNRALGKYRYLSINSNATRVYPSVALSTGVGKAKLKCVHVLVATAFISNPQGKIVVNHKDGNKQNSNVSNLEWVTPKENQEHAYRTGLKARPIGEKNPGSVLSEAQVLEIFHSKEIGRALAIKYGVCENAIYLIKRGVNWSYLTGKQYVRKGIRKFTNEEILEIYNSNKKQTELAIEYGVRQCVISSLKTGRRHSNITGKIRTK